MKDVKLSEREIEEDIRFAETVEDAAHDTGCSKIEDLVGIIHSHFKFGYGGFNGWFKNWTELESEVKDFIKSYKEIK